MKKMATILGSLGIILLLVIGCATAPPPTKEAVLTKADVKMNPVYQEKFTATVASEISKEAPRDYRVGPKDVLSITVYGEEDLSLKDVLVTSDGFLSMPLIGRFSVEGMTTLDIEQNITKRLGNGYLVNPQVSVTVKSFKSKKAFILGAVEKPGVYPLEGEAVLLELISSSGGILYDSAGKYILIWRHAAPTETGEESGGQVIKIALQRLLKEGDMRLNVGIQDRDVVFVPQAEHIYIIGEVKEPGSFPVFKNDITVLEAITMSGGFTPIAAPNRTRIIRVENGLERTITVRMKDIIKGERSKDVVLKSGDIVVVPESLF